MTTGAQTEETTSHGHRLVGVDTGSLTGQNAQKVEESIEVLVSCLFGAQSGRTFRTSIAEGYI